MDTLHIRAAVVADVAMLGLIEVSADEIFKQVGHDEFSGSISDDDAAKGVAEGRITVAELGETVVGWVIVGRLAGELCIEQISVHPDLHGRGIGSRLMDHVISQADKADEKSIILDTQSDVAWNQPWYEKLGFEVVPEQDWNAAMTEVAARQTAMGLDWKTRVHMRRRR